ncbi:reverse transcriptase domain-containing protein [Tanacetum coccineum]
MGTNITNQSKVIRCYNCKGKGHMARHCTQPKRPKNSEWFKEKMLLAQALEAGVILDEEQLAFLAYTRDIVDSGLESQTLPTTAIFFLDIMCTAMHPYADLVKCAEMEYSYIDEYSRCVQLEAELSKKKDMVEKAVYNELSNRFSRLEKWCISLEIKVQQKTMAEQQEIQQQDHLDEELVPVNDQVRIGLSNFRIALEKQQPYVIYKLFIGNLKFANKGEKDPIYGMAIPKEMMSDEIQASADYSNYLEKYMGTQLVKEEVADIVDSEETDEHEVHLNKRHTGIVIGRWVHKESKEGTLNHLKKLKGIKTLSSAAQYLVDMKKSTKASKEDFILKQCPKGPGEGSSIVLDNLDEPSDSSSSESEDEEGFLSTDDQASQDKSDNERTKIDDSQKAEDAKDADDQAGEEQAVDEQARIEQIGKYGNQFINDNPDVLLTDVLKDPTDIEIQSIVDVLVHQEEPVVQITPLVDTVISIIPEKTTPLPKQQPPQTQPKRSKTKVILKNSKKPEENLDADDVLKRLIRLEKKVEAMSKIDHIVAIEEYVQANVMNEVKNQLPKFLPKLCLSMSDQGWKVQFEIEAIAKGELDPTITLRKRNHDDDQDPHVDSKKEKKEKKKKKRRRKNFEPSKKDKDTAEESVQDAAMDAEESIEDDVVDAEDPTNDDAAPNQDRSKWFKQDDVVRPETPDPEWFKEPNANVAPEKPYSDGLDILGRTTIPVDFFFNKDLEYLKTETKEKKYASSLTKSKAVRYELGGLEEMIPKLWSSSKVQYDKDATLVKVRITKMIAGIEDCHHGPSDAMNNPPSYPVFSQKKSVGIKSLLEVTAA